MWDDRYAEPGFAYGIEPNGFLASCADELQGPILCLASGEGRNAVWLAERGHEVHAVDLSAVGIEKTQQLAASRGVDVEARVADLSSFDLGRERWGGIVAIFAHLPDPVRRRVHAAIPAALKPGGTLVFEAYTPRQLTHRTGGPPVLEMLYEPADIRVQLEGLHLLRCEEIEREVHEGKYHRGRASVLQILGRR